MKPLSELIEDHVAIVGDKTQIKRTLPTMSELRKDQHERQKEAKRAWYHENKQKVLEQQRNEKKKNGK